VAVSSQQILVTAVTDVSPFLDSGSAYRLERRGREWLETEKLVPSDPEQGAQFGFSLAIAGSDAIVGTGSLGAVYVYSLARLKRK
jgi:hypothetical protein